MTSANHPLLSERPYTAGEIAADIAVHCVGIAAALVGVTVLLWQVAGSREPGVVVAAGVYGFTLLAMLSASALYNAWPMGRLKWLLRRLDHSGIFLLIAGTYTPLLTQLSSKPWAWVLGLVIWTGCLLGIVLKLSLPGRFDRLAIVIYLALGWLGLAASPILIASFSAETLALIVIGGVVYSLGVLFYLWNSLRFHNVIWHGFVCLAAICHYAAIFRSLDGV
ncbi:PAQR family membrane homeostasis protein TrhA [Labrys okinawensis]|uniref:PAQR family membrane homeostasis protein TrhA n=1 Tax=Labrys okinawensis TaxID=346911 RepID=UPI0039BD7986